MFLNKIFISNR